MDIAAALQHQVCEDEAVLWMAPPQRRLAALTVLAQLPVESPLSESVACAVLRSCFDTEAGIAAAALSCRRLHIAIQDVPAAESGRWFETLVQRLHVGETTDCEKGKIALAIEDICHDQQGRAALIAVGACGVLVKVLKISETEETRRYISLAIFNLARDDEGRRALVAAGACEAATHALRSAASDDAQAWISYNFCECPPPLSIFLGLPIRCVQNPCVFLLFRIANRSWICRCGGTALRGTSPRSLR